MPKNLDGVTDPKPESTFLKAVVVLRPTHQGTTEQQIIDWCHANMAVYKAPRAVHFASALPKSGTGKVMWRLLQEKEKEQTSQKNP